MTNEKKLAALYNAANRTWNDAFDGWDWVDINGKQKRYLLGENDPGNGFAFFLSANEDLYSGLIYIEYEPGTDVVKVVVKTRPILARFKEDIKNLFEKHSPFNMSVSFEKGTTPILTREEKVEPEGFLNFLKEFKKSFKEYYPLFYMFTIAEKEWYERFHVESTDC